MTALRAARLRRTRLIDRVVAGAITAGGSLILLAVALLMVFLLAECLPLLRDGAADAHIATPGPPMRVLAASEDEYREAVTLVGADAALHRLARDGADTRLPFEGARAPLAGALFSPAGRVVAAIDAGSVLHVWSFRMRARWLGAARILVPQLAPLFDQPVPAGATLLAVAGETDNATVLLAAGGRALLVRGGEAGSTITTLATPEIPTAGALAWDGAQAWLAAGRQLLWFPLARASAEPAAAASAPTAAPATAMAVLLGDTTCLVGDAAGAVTAWQAVAGEVAGSRRLDRAATFPGGSPVRGLAVSARDKSFLVLRERGFEVAHLTSRRVWVRPDDVPPEAALAGFSPRRDGLFAVTAAGEVHRWRLELPHPKVTARTLLTPVRYEGFTRPELVWQSSGGSNDFEAKMSLVPLLLGTFKGALYALLLAGPCAIAAALYASQLAPPRVRSFAKPVVELMAALPSVVVGFLAALFLAPLLERHIVGTLLLVVLLPLLVAAAGAGWGAAPLPARRRLGRGGELAVIAAVASAAIVLSFALEGTIEGALFGGDFRRFLHETLSLGFDQRNAVVVGFALGFAVIPIVFTLAEDAFSNVPPSLVSASLALGATRWQAARTVVLPAASPGVFAALMTGLGRAVGETMIVLMATGNTPILSLSPFDGMRTMAANIAVELPEAPFGSSLYRVLILTALALFAMTFALNTAAAIVSRRLRARFGRVAA